MNDFNISSQGQTGNWDIDVNKSQGTAATADKAGTGVAKDSLELSEGKKTLGSLSVEAGHPILDAPSADAQPVKEMTPQQLANMTFTTKSPSEVFTTVFDGELAKMQLSNQLTDSQAANLRFVFNNPANPKSSDQSIQAQLGEIISSVKEKVQSTIKKEVEPEPDPEGFSQQVDSDFELSFAQAVKQAVSQMNLPEDQAKALIAKTIFAHLYPNEVKRSTSDLASQLEKKVAEQMAEKYGLPDDWKFTPQTDKFETKLSVDYNSAFNALMNGDLEDPAVKALLEAHPELAAQLDKLSPEQKAQLKYLHYHPEAQFPDADILKNLNGQLQSLLLGNLASEFGFPAGWEPPSVKATVQDSVIQGYYREAFFKKLDAFGKAQVPPLTDKQISELKKAFDYPDNPSVSANSKKIVEQLKGEAIAEIGPKLGLPVGWIPPVGPPSGGHIDEQSATVALNGINTVQEMLGGLEALAVNLPPSPMRAKLLDFLKSISQALSALKEQVFAMQNTDAGKAKELGKAELDTQMNKLEKQRQEMEKQKESGKPGMAGFQKFMQAFGPCAAVIAVIVAVCTMGTMTALAVAVAVAAIAYTVADAIVQGVTGTGIIGQIMKGITELIAMIIPEGPGRMAVDIIVKVVLIVACLALVIAANPMIGLTVGVQAAGQAVTESKIIQNLIGAMGGDQMAQEITAMVLVTVVTTTVTIAVSIFTFYMQAAAIPAKVAEKVAEVTKKITEMLLKVLQTVMKIEQQVVDKTVKIAQTAVKILDPANWIQLMNQTVEISGTIATQATVIKSQLDLASLVMQKARLQADMEVLTAMVKLLRQLINKIMSGLSDEGGQQTQEIANIQKNVWDSSSKITTNIASSGAA